MFYLLLCHISIQIQFPRTCRKPTIYFNSIDMLNRLRIKKSLGGTEDVFRPGTSLLNDVTSAHVDRWQVERKNISKMARSNYHTKLRNVLPVNLILFRQHTFSVQTLKDLNWKILRKIIVCENGKLVDTVVLIVPLPFCSNMYSFLFSLEPRTNCYLSSRQEL